MMLPEQARYQSAMNKVIVSVLVVLALSVLIRVTSGIPFWKNPVGDGPAQVGDYIGAGLGLVMLATLAGTYSSLCAVIVFWLSALVRLASLPAKDQVIEYIGSFATKIIFLLYLVAIYNYFTPILFDWNARALFFEPVPSLETYVNVVFGVLGLLVLYGLWVDLRRLIGVASRKITQAVMDVTTKVTTAVCPEGHSNPVGAQFCSTCGKAVKPPKPEEAQPATCPSCSKSVRPGAQFCSECGYDMASKASA